MTDAHRPLDDLTRDLRGSAAYSTKDASMRLGRKAADAIDHLRDDLTRFHDAATRPNNQMWPTTSDAQRAGTMRYEAAVGPRLAAKVGSDPLPEANDAVASLAPLTAEDGVRRWRRRIDLDGGKYSIFLAEAFPPDFDLPGEPKHLPAAFLRSGEPWLKGNDYRHSGFVNALAEALWARAYVPPTVADVAPPGPTEWTVASAFEQLEKCRYACEGGPLENNAAYRWLKDDLATKTVKSALDALRPILIHHRLETFISGKNGARVCRCGSSFSDSSGWVDHVIALRAPPNVTSKSSETLASAWRAVPLTAGLIFDAISRVDVGRDGVVFALSCEVERAARAVVEGKS